MSCLGVLVKYRRHSMQWLHLPEKECQEVYPSTITFLQFAHELVQLPALNVQDLYRVYFLCNCWLWSKSFDHSSLEEIHETSSSQPRGA